MANPDRHVVCPSCGSVNRILSSQPALQAKCGKCHLLLFTGKPVATDEAAFERHITRNDIPVLVDIWASWCQPCLAMAPAYERAAAELEPDFRLLKVNADQAQQLMARFDIRSIPTLMLFVRGRPIAQTSGALDTRRITEWARHSAPRS
ncbi:MAG TPA: thioredoxin TrxC [Acidobacteriaceae bacterium]